MKKKLLSTLLVGVIIAGLTGCGSSSKNANDSTNDVSNNDNSKNTNVITCVQLQPNSSFNELNRGTKTIFDTDRITKVIYFYEISTNKKAEEYCNNEGKRLAETFKNVSYETKDNNCNIIFNVAKMSDSELEKTNFGKTIDTKTLITEMSYNDYYDYLSSNEYAFCNKGDKVEKNHPNTIVGEYDGLIYASNGGVYDWKNVTMIFEDDNYSCNYSVDNNEYKIVGNYIYDSNTGTLELSIDKDNSKGNLSVVSACYGTKRVYKDIEEYDLEIVDYMSDLDTDYQKSIKLNNK